MKDNKDLEPRTIEEFRYRKDWLKWKDIIQTEIKLTHQTQGIWTCGLSTKGCQTSRIQMGPCVKKKREI